MDWKVFVKCYVNITFVLRMFEFAFIINKSKNWTENVFTPIRIIMFKESDVAMKLCRSYVSCLFQQDSVLVFI